VPQPHHHDPIRHLNTNRNDDLLAVIRQAGYPAATAVRADRVDPVGIDVTVTTPGGTTTGRVEFPEPIDDFPAGVRVAFVRWARRARAAAADHADDRSEEIAP